MDWLSDVITPDVSVRLRCKASQTDTAVVLVVPTTSVRVQTVPSKGHNKACQVATSARQNDMTSSEQLMVMQGIVSNLGALRDEEHEHDELRQEQIEQLEKQFDYKIAQLQQEIGQQARILKDSEECRVKAEEEATRRENKLRTQLDKRAEEEVKLKEILSNLEHENAKLQRLCTENAPVEALYSPRAITTLERDGSSVNNVDIIQEIIASQPVDVYKKVPVPREPSPEPVYTPFKDKPYITCQYNHPTETLADVRRRAEDELLSKIKEITGSRSTAKLSDEDYALHQAQRRQQDRGDHETRRNRLKDELSELAQSPSAYPSAALPPKSPSVRRESTHSAKDYYKAGGYNDFDEEETQSYGVEYQGDEEPEIHTAVKMRPKKLKSKDIEEEESIFSFDGWSKNKARNSMSVADAKENIPMGHVERMRHEVAAKNKARTKHLSVGVSMLPGDSSVDAQKEDKRYSEPCRRAVEEDDFTISSISDIDLSPVGMSVEVKKRGDVSDDDQF